MNLNVDDTSSSDNDEEILEYVLMRRPKTFRLRVSQINLWDDFDFYNRFRMTKQSVLWIVDNISKEIEHPTTRNNVVSALYQVLLTLRFYATGNIQQCSGDIMGLQKSTACRIIHKVTRTICLSLKYFIKMPETEEEIRNTVKNFYDVAKFPNIIGAKDCTHVPIINPGGDNAELYRNRKNYYSFNVQVVANADLKIMNIVARWPRPAHDSTIFQASNIHTRLENSEIGSCCLLGDRGYALKTYLMTPLTNPTTAAAKLYNESHIRTRNVVERTFGVWKQRFPCIATKLRVKVDRVQAVIVATAILHNICINNKDGMPINDIDENNYGEEIDILLPIEQSTGTAQSHRANLITNYFGRLLSSVPN